VSITRLGRLAVVGAAVALLTGCGAARPGIAAEVGDEPITVNEVDELAASVCAVQEELPDEDPNAPGVVSGERARNSALQGLILRSIADQMADDYSVESGQDFQGQVDQVRLQFGSVDDDKLEAALPAYTSIAYFIDIMRQIGAKTDSNLSGDQALGAGIEVAQEWQADNGVETNPMFGSFSIGDQEIQSERSDIAFAVSESAKDAEEGSESYAASLPESQRCG
jgi:hypothetical protein